ncbi:hypothetical protein Tco_0651533 [Tanacetum coccineum]|uniref:Uncharacterized protein n=1 Tax=Tanacetum coccineum TaxID=301880 RepID=A0ABQ4WV45_9ASTR
MSLVLKAQVATLDEGTGSEKDADISSEIVLMKRCRMLANNLKVFSMLNAPWSTCDQKFQVGIVTGVQDAGVHVVNEESGDAAVADQIEESDHVVQDEWANIVRVKDEMLATITDRTKGSKKKRKAAGGASGSNLPPKKLRADYDTSGAGVSTDGKSVVALQGLLKRSTLSVEVGVAAVATLPFITSFVSLTPEHEGAAALI